jgi:hypothetical protein
MEDVDRQNAANKLIENWTAQWVELERQNNAHAHQQSYDVEYDDAARPWSGFTDNDRNNVIQRVQEHADSLTQRFGTYYQIINAENGISCEPDTERNTEKAFQDRVHADNLKIDQIHKKRQQDFPSFYPKDIKKRCNNHDCKKDGKDVILVEACTLVGDVQRMVSSNDIERALTGPRWCYKHRDSAPANAHPMAYRSNSGNRVCECCCMRGAQTYFCSEVCQHADDVGDIGKRGERLMKAYMVPVMAKYNGRQITDSSALDNLPGMLPDGVWQMQVGDRTVTIIGEADGDSHKDAENYRDCMKPAVAAGHFLQNPKDTLIFSRFGTTGDIRRSVSVWRGWILWLLFHIWDSKEAMPPFIYLLVGIPVDNASRAYPAKTISVQDPPMPTTLSYKDAQKLHTANMALEPLTRKGVEITTSNNAIVQRVRDDLGDDLWREVHWQGCLAPLSHGRTYVNEFMKGKISYTCPVRRNVGLMFPMSDIDGKTENPADPTSKPRIPEKNSRVSKVKLLKQMEVYRDKLEKLKSHEKLSWQNAFNKMCKVVEGIIERDAKKERLLQLFDHE